MVQPYSATGTSLEGVRGTHRKPDEPRVAIDEGLAERIRGARHLHNELLRTQQLDSAATFWTEDLVVLSSLGVRSDGPAAMRDAMARDTAVGKHY